MIADNQLFINFNITRRRSRVIKVHKTPSEGELSLKIIEKVWGLICFFMRYFLWVSAWLLSTLIQNLIVEVDRRKYCRMQ